MLASDPSSTTTEISIRGISRNWISLDPPSTSITSDVGDTITLALALGLADVITQAAASDAKVILAGDTQQLQAVQNGGGMSLLAEALGYARLAEPARFRAGWEQQASLRLRDGDATVLAEYDQHARILGGEPEQMTERRIEHDRDDIEDEDGRDGVCDLSLGRLQHAGDRPDRRRAADGEGRCEKRASSCVRRRVA